MTSERKPSMIGWGMTAFIAALLGFGGGSLYTNWQNAMPTDAPRVEVRENSSEFHFINPLLECDLGSRYLKGNTLPDENGLRQIINDAKHEHRASFVSLYYRDLNNGPWVGINETEKFFPASLMKIPLMLHFYKEAETNPSILDQTLTLDRSKVPVMTQRYSSPMKLEDGKAYTVEELIEHALRYSDNDAAALLFSQANNEHLESLYDDLHITLPTDENGTNFMTARNYATFFRILYNSSYLTNERSEHALSILSQSSFNQGMTAKLPPDLVVAHKFGEKPSADGSDKQLHDCGIVYAPNKPYLLCIMTRGSDMDQMAGLIANLSRSIYDQVNGQMSGFDALRP